MRKLGYFISSGVILIIGVSVVARGIVPMDDLEFTQGRDLVHIEKGSKAVRMSNVEFEVLDRDFRPKGMQPQRYLPHTPCYTKVVRDAKEINLSKWGADTDLGPAHGVSISVVPAGSYAGLTFVGTMYLNYAGADTIFIYWSEDGTPPWHSWWKIYTPSGWDFNDFCICCGRDRLAVIYQIRSSTKSVLGLYFFPFEGDYIYCFIDSTADPNAEMHPDCVSDAEDWAQDIWYYLVYSTPEYSAGIDLRFLIIDENCGVHSVCFLDGAGSSKTYWDGDIDYDDNGKVCVTYHVAEDMLVRARCSENYGESWGPKLNVGYGADDYQPRIAVSGEHACVVMQDIDDGIAFRCIYGLGDSLSYSYIPRDSGDATPTITELAFTAGYGVYYSKNARNARAFGMQCYPDICISGDSIMGDVWANVRPYAHCYEIAYLWDSTDVYGVATLWIDSRTGTYHAWYDHGTIIIAPPVATWTILVYLDADNDLNDAGNEDLFEEMQTIGSSYNVNIIVQIDNIETNDPPTARRYYVQQGDCILLEDLGEIDMGDPQTLADFGIWGITNYPANYYMLIIWDHGNGWYKQSKRGPIKGCCFDSSSRNIIDVANGELATALSQIYDALGRKLDILGFDACLMGMIEVMYECKDYTEIMIGSEHIIPGDGWPYDDWLDALVNINNGNMAPDELATQIVESYCASYNGGSQGTASVTLSAIDLGYPFTFLVNKVDAFANALISNWDDYETEIQAARETVQDFSNPNHIDLYHFAQLIHQATEGDLQNAAQALIDCFDDVILANCHTGYGLENAHGIAIYYPSDPDFYDTRYSQLKFANATSWDEFISGVPWVEEISEPILSLYISPNPAAENPSIHYEVPERAYVVIKIYNCLGECVKLLLNKEIGAGEHVIHWDGKNDSGGRVNSGIYFVRLTVDKITLTRKLLYIK